MKGRMGGSGQGPSGKCRCSYCGYTEEHQTGEPCDQKECPKCGRMMDREENIVPRKKAWFQGFAVTRKGGPGSGNHGHGGRPGQRGGSAPGRSAGMAGVQVGDYSKFKLGSTSSRAELQRLVGARMRTVSQNAMGPDNRETKVTSKLGGFLQEIVYDTRVPDWRREEASRAMGFETLREDSVDAFINDARKAEGITGWMTY